MRKPDDGGRSTPRALAVAMVALAGLAFAVTPLSGRLDDALLDIEWQALARLEARAAPDDIVIVGVDEASVRAILEPPGLWHVPLGTALARIASARPRAIVLDLPLPERSYDAIRPGLDRALFDGLASAVESAPLVASLNIDPRTRGVRPIHKPYLALLGESRLGLALTARDPDGVARRYSLTVPTEDGGFPSLEGRLCQALKADCTEGLIHLALGRPYTYVPFKDVVAMAGEELPRRLFRGRIVIVGEALSYGGRIEVPVNLAGWENDGDTSPGVVVRAQTLRTALARAAPTEASRPLRGLMVLVAALVVLVRDWRMALLTAVLGLAASAVGAAAVLRAGYYVPVGAVAATLAVAVLARVAAAWHARRGRP